MTRDHERRIMSTILFKTFMPTKINGPTEARYSMSFEASFSTV